MTLKYAFLTITIIINAILFYLPALAQSTATTCAGDKCKLPNPLAVGTKDPSVAELVGRFAKSLMPFLGVGALIMFIVGAILWILSSGNPEKVKKGQDTVVWAVLGAAVAIGSYLALQFIIKVVTGELKFT